jgi:hypothetical protein
MIFWRNSTIVLFITMIAMNIAWAAPVTFDLSDITDTLTNVLAGVLVIGIAALTIVGAIYGIRKFASAFR